MFHHFSDRLEATVTSYSLEEIMAEKIRSIFQRTRSRDLYDVWQLSSHVDQDRVKSILYQKCEHKSVDIDISSFIGRRDAFKSSWEASLHHQMEKVPDFDLAFMAVSGLIQYYLD